MLFLTPDNDFAGKDQVTTNPQINILSLVASLRFWFHFKQNRSNFYVLRCDALSLHLFWCRLLRQMKSNKQQLTCENWFREKRITNAACTLILIIIFFFFVLLYNYFPCQINTLVWSLFFANDIKGSDYMPKVFSKLSWEICVTEMILTY